MYARPAFALILRSIASTSSRSKAAASSPGRTIPFSRCRRRRGELERSGSRAGKHLGRDLRDVRELRDIAGMGESVRIVRDESGVIVAVEVFGRWRDGEAS